MATIPSGQKILTSAPEVNTNYGGPASLQALNTWYTMEDISNTVKPYKVYTALLTQSGTGDELNKNSGALTKGVTYKIDDNSGGADFTNVGAPNNNNGTFFVANANIEPNSYGTGNLTYDPGAPVVTVLENTIGNIWFVYDGVGYYSVNSNDLYTTNKTGVYLNSVDFTGSYEVYPASTNIIIIGTADSNRAESDNYLSNSFIEIRVYN